MIGFSGENILANLCLYLVLVFNSKICRCTHHSCHRSWGFSQLKNRKIAKCYFAHLVASSLI